MLTCTKCHKSPCPELPQNGTLCLACSPNRRLAMLLYEESCTRQQWSRFVCPSGLCFSCNYDHTEKGTLIPSHLTTGCPRCHRSYCD